MPTLPPKKPWRDRALFVPPRHSIPEPAHRQEVERLLQQGLISPEEARQLMDDPHQLSVLVWRCCEPYPWIDMLWHGGRLLVAPVGYKREKTRLVSTFSLGEMDMTRSYWMVTFAFKSATFHERDMETGHEGDVILSVDEDTFEMPEHEAEEIESGRWTR